MQDLIQFLFSGGQQNHPHQTDLQVSSGYRYHTNSHHNIIIGSSNPTIFRGLCAPEDPQGPLEGLPDREAQPGAVPPPGDAQGLQHQREDQPHGDPRPPPHVALLESKLPPPS